MFKAWNKLVDIVVMVLSTFMWISALKAGWNDQVMIGKVLIVMFLLISLTFITRVCKPLLNGIKERRTIKRAKKYMFNQMMFLM